MCVGYPPSLHFGWLTIAEKTSPSTPQVSIQPPLLQKKSLSSPKVPLFPLTNFAHIKNVSFFLFWPRWDGSWCNHPFEEETPRLSKESRGETNEGGSLFVQIYSDMSELCYGSPESVFLYFWTTPQHICSTKSSCKMKF